MNDDLLDYLLATNSMDDFLGYEPKCPNCGNKLIPIEYGMPSPDIIEKVEKGEVHLGGCEFDDNNPKYYCKNCKRSYFENMKDYIEDSNWLEDLK